MRRHEQPTGSAPRGRCPGHRHCRGRGPCEATTLHGPVSVTVQTPTAVRLDGLVAASEPLAAMPNWGGVAVVLAAAAALAGLRRMQRSKW